MDHLGGRRGLQTDERDVAVVAHQLVGRGRHGEDHHSELGPLQQDVLEETQEDVRADCPLVGLVDDNHPVVLQKRVRHHLSQQHVVGAVPAW